jgi:hypothetical protein
MGQRDIPVISHDCPKQSSFKRMASICTPLPVARDVSGNPIPHSLVIYVAVLSDEVLVGVEIVSELIGIYLE